jgi:hypothetical protein
MVEGLLDIVCVSGAVMAKRKESDESGQVNLKLTGDLWRRFRAVADGLGLDRANFARMLVVENLKKYERRLSDIEASQERDN